MALEKLLNGPVMHGGTHLLYREEAFAKNWVEICQGRLDGDKERTLKLLRENMKGFVGCTDVPPVVVIPELLELYPEAKVILVTRDPVKWWKSFGNILAHADKWFLFYLTAISPTLRWWPPYVRVWKRNADRLLGTEQTAPGTYGPQLIEAHNKMVIDLVPKEKLLIMRLEDGWEPICKFLNKPIPDEPFPRVNDAANADKVAAMVSLKLLGMWLGLLSATGGAIYMGFQVCKKWL
ncbi:hypothetical protein JX265_008041 [Neoarthrinium moseri]|uniref:NAD dependent epimerase/dehydratase n=1 Tax=Neoarthrinium moseri TaxID=1658444 RepID=A0A9Q0AKJ5_9PEZI|nr:hypothetical protein JX265_008041 [Neoarthrinium moseri]